MAARSQDTAEGAAGAGTGGERRCGERTEGEGEGVEGCGEREEEE